MSRDVPWRLLAALTTALLSIAAVLWTRDNPQSHSSDEAFYFNEVIDDCQRVQAADGAAVKVKTLVKTFLYEDRGRPPAYRILVFPLDYTVGFNSASVRLFSFLFFVAAIGLTYLTVRSVATPASAALSALFLALCPGMIFQSMTFGTEYPLFLATSAMLYFLFSGWNAGKDSAVRVVGLGLSLGLGGLSKTTFLFIGGPTMFLALVLVLARKISAPTPKALLGSGLIGLLLLWPWWARNLEPAVIFAREARGFSRHALDSPPFSMLWDWLVLFLETGLGPALAVVVLLVLATWGGQLFRKRRQQENSAPRTHSTIALTCFLSPVPLLVAHLSSQNQNIMHVTPIMPFLAVGLGVLADSTRWERKRILGASIAGLLLIQLAMTLWPLAARVQLPVDPPQTSGRPPWLVYAKMDNWDWEELRSLTRAHGLNTPAISFLGNARTFNAASIAFPWVAANEPLPTKPRWLWRYEDGPMDWEKVMSSVVGSDIVLTIPGYIGMRSDKQDLDNRHNAELAQRLQQDGQFCGPAILQAGRFEKVNILVFARRSIVGGGCDRFHP